VLRRDREGVELYQLIAAVPRGRNALLINKTSENKVKMQRAMATNGQRHFVARRSAIAKKTFLINARWLRRERWCRRAPHVINASASRSAARRRRRHSASNLAMKNFLKKSLDFARVQASVLSARVQSRAARRLHQRDATSS